MRAAQDFNIDVAKSWMIGDSHFDVLCGKNAGCSTAFIDREKRDALGADLVGESLLELVEKVLKED